MATELPIDEAPESVGAALTPSPECADEIFLEGPRSRFEEFITLLANDGIADRHDPDWLRARVNCRAFFQLFASLTNRPGP
jgi:hypothetical protein